MQEQLKRWLEECGMQDVQPVEVLIDGTAYTGAIYTNPHHGNQSMMYVIGDHPLLYKKGRKPYLKRRVCFTIDGDTRDWYIACYFHPGLVQTYFKQTVQAKPEHQPFGNNFIMSAWDIPGKPDDKIDSYEPKPYERRRIEVKAS